jgi:predicted  nucleic acid-binding Zn ribbon protein
MIYKILYILPYAHRDTIKVTFRKAEINSDFAEESDLPAPLVIYHLTLQSCRTLAHTNNI